MEKVHNFFLIPGFAHVTFKIGKPQGQSRWDGDVLTRAATHKEGMIADWMFPV